MSTPRSSILLHIARASRTPALRACRRVAPATTTITTSLKTNTSTSTSTSFARTMATNAPSATAQAQEQQDKSFPTFASVGIKNTNINTAPGVQLSDQQKTIVGSVLDLFEGHPSLAHLSLWRPTATFTDPITVASGYDKFAAQWYGLPAVFSPIAIQSHTVTSSGNPLELDLRNKYVVKGIKKEQVVDSKVKIWLDEKDGRIDRLEDRWDGKLPEGAVSEAFRKLNAVTVPMLVKVPKTEEEDKQMKAEREKSS